LSRGNIAISLKSERSIGVNATRLTATAVFMLATAMLATATPAQTRPTEGEIPALAFILFEQLRDKDVRLPDGTMVRVAGMPSRQIEGVSVLLTPERVEECLRTVGEAQGWPEAWVVAQDETYEFDLVFPVRLAIDGRIENPDPVLALTRREWDVPELRRAVREATGSKLRGRDWTLVVQGFTRRVIERFVYEVPPRPDRGLMALLPEGTLLREASMVELGDGRHHTLAIVLEQAEFVPSNCRSCAARLYGHADTGRIFAVLTDDERIEDRVELTSYMLGEQGRPLLPRYECTDEDRDPEARKIPHDERFAERETVTLIRLRDLDGDGHALEFSLIGGFEDCDKHETVVVGISPGLARLRILGRP
jgi:hypothetical protein